MINFIIPIVAQAYHKRAKGAMNSQIKGVKIYLLAIILLTLQQNDGIIVYNYTKGGK